MPSSGVFRGVREERLSWQTARQTLRQADLWARLPWQQQKARERSEREAADLKQTLYAALTLVSQIVLCSPTVPWSEGHHHEEVHGFARSEVVLITQYHQLLQLLRSAVRSAADLVDESRVSIRLSLPTPAIPTWSELQNLPPVSPSCVCQNRNTSSSGTSVENLERGITSATLEHLGHRTTRTALELANRNPTGLQNRNISVSHLSVRSDLFSKAVTASLAAARRRRVGPRVLVPPLLAESAATAAAGFLFHFLLRELCASGSELGVARGELRNLWAPPPTHPRNGGYPAGSASTRVVDARGRAAANIWRESVYKSFTVQNLAALRCTCRTFFLEGKGVREVLELQ
jgi:hypothetical protein